MRHNYIVENQLDDGNDIIIEQIKEWPFLETLAQQYAGFTLSLDVVEKGPQYNIFSYRNDEARRSINLVYDKDTKDYLTLVTVGLTAYYDVNLICGDQSSVEKALAERLQPTLDRLAGRENHESIFRSKKILEWPYQKNLPAECAGFQLFIGPAQSVKTINGSYIILDYSDFNTASNLIIYYNVYRDEFFGEFRLKHTPQMTAMFDAKELDDLAQKLEASLAPALNALRERLDGGEAVAQGDEK